MCTYTYLIGKHRAFFCLHTFGVATCVRTPQMCQWSGLNMGTFHHAPLLLHCYEVHGWKWQRLTMEPTSPVPQTRRVKAWRQRRTPTKDIHINAAITASTLLGCLSTIFLRLDVMISSYLATYVW